MLVGRARGSIPDPQHTFQRTCCDVSSQSWRSVLYILLRFTECTSSELSLSLATSHDAGFNSRSIMGSLPSILANKHSNPSTTAREIVPERWLEKRARLSRTQQRVDDRCLLTPSTTHETILRAYYSTLVLLLFRFARSHDHSNSTPT